jgi:hypothetical protein
MYELQKQAGKDFPEYDPDSRYITIRGRGIDHNPKFFRITIEHGSETLILSRAHFAFFSGDALILELPDHVKAGEVKLTIENSDGERYSRPVTQTFVIKPRP